MSKVTGTNPSAIDEMRNEKKGAPGRGIKKNSHTQNKKCAGRNRCLIKTMLTTLRPPHAPRRVLDRPQPWPIYGRPVVNDTYIHVFLISVPFLLLGDLAASENSGGDETPASRRRHKHDWKSYGLRFSWSLSLFLMRSKSADELAKI